SRFTWAFDLARAELLSPTLGAGELFWELFDEWEEQNPPNTGVNWACGQEATFRLISCLCAAQAMPHLLTEDRTAKLNRLADVTAARILSNIAYARSQRNNHHASEAVGLITAGCLFPGDEADIYRRRGFAELAEVAGSLILEDGGSSQYSTNYHRVFLHDLVWARAVASAAGCTLPAEIDAAAIRATRYLHALMEPASGMAPFMGPDDGARVLPLSAAPHRHVRDDVTLSLATFMPEVGGIDGQESEALAWFGYEAGSPGVNRDLRSAYSFPDMGVHVLRNDDWTVYVRCGSPEFRPTEDDQLHCDVWYQGLNIAPDSGTQSYSPAIGEPGALASAENHNSPV
ncbi:MAG: hypothetical protein GY701_11405, partial [Sulfitobacter sp.]|nr:hypothetical protein [Sulfitobacter sp.]